MLGFLVQWVNLCFGYLVYNQPTFLFLLLPAGMFLVNWWQHPKRKPQVVKEIFACDSRRAGMCCDRARGHDGLHVGFENANEGKLKLTSCWGDSFHGILRV